MSNFKNYLSLGVLLAVGLVLAVAQPEGFIAALLVQLLALAVVGAGAAKLSKVLVSFVVLIVAGAIAWFQLNGAAPVFPVFSGDLVQFAQALFEWLQAFVVFASPIVGAAMLQYNIILERLLVLIGGQIGLALEPEEE